MIRDMTIGQYFPLNSVLHRCDPRLKLLLAIAYIVIIFITGTFLALAVMLLFLLTAILISKIPFKTFLKSIKSILPFIAVASLLNIFYSEGQTIFKFYFISITYEGLYRAGIMMFRIILLVVASSLLTYTTSPTELTDGIERLLSPLKFIGLGTAVHMLAMMMTLALRFIPTLLEETSKIMNAQKARGADLESGNIIKRIKAMIPIFVPLLVSAFRRAADLAEAMECRCYNGGKGRTRMNKLRFSGRDAIVALVFIVSMTAALAVSILL